LSVSNDGGEKFTGHAQTALDSLNVGQIQIGLKIIRRSIVLTFQLSKKLLVELGEFYDGGIFLPKQEH